MAYDADADLLYVGTGNAEPWAQQLRTSTPKDNLYVCSILAVSAATGELRWHYQVVPGDIWDFDSVQGLVLADLTIDGRPRKTIMQANKDGFFYVIDRLTGRLISAEPFSRVTWAKGIDVPTGRPNVNPEAYYTTEPISISPGGGGAHNWSPMSFNPVAGLVYIPTSTNNSFTYQAEPTFNPLPGRMTGTVRPMPAATRPSPPAIGPEPIDAAAAPGRGALVAWDPVAQRMRWRRPGGGGIGGGTMTTAANLVFQVVNDGRLLAYTADTGEKLLEIQTGLRSGMGPPITYEVDGRQYVALMGGVGTAAPGGNAGPGNQSTPFAPKLLAYAVEEVESGKWKVEK
jgi:quinohemoprotein ethanol dehydrogenase